MSIYLLTYWIGQKPKQTFWPIQYRAIYRTDISHPNSLPAFLPTQRFSHLLVVLFFSLASGEDRDFLVLTPGYVIIITVISDYKYVENEMNKSMLVCDLFSKEQSCFYNNSVKYQLLKNANFKKDRISFILKTVAFGELYLEPLKYKCCPPSK